MHSTQGIPWKLGTNATHHLRSRCLHLLSQLECESREKVGADYRNENKSLGLPGQNSLCDGDFMILQLGIPEILRRHRFWPITSLNPLLHFFYKLQRRLRADLENGPCFECDFGNQGPSLNPYLST